MNSFRLFAMKRELGFLFPFQSFFKLHDWATERKKDEKWRQKDIFFSHLINLNEFYN